MILENKLNITDPVDLAREEERISKIRAKEMLFDTLAEISEGGKNDFRE